MAKAVIIEEKDVEEGFEEPLDEAPRHESGAVQLRGTTDASISMGGGDIRDAGPGLLIVLAVLAFWFLFKSFFARLMTVVFAALAFGWYALVWLDDKQNSKAKSADEAMLEEELGPAAKTEKSTWKSFKTMIDKEEKARREKTKAAAADAEGEPGEE